MHYGNMMDFSQGLDGGWIVLFAVLGILVVVLLITILIVLINKKNKE